MTDGKIEIKLKFGKRKKGRVEQKLVRKSSWNIQFQFYFEINAQRTQESHSSN